MEFKESQTKVNLMRAFAGESQAASRYRIAAGEAQKQGHRALSKVFLFTAEQEKEHAEIFYKHLKDCAGSDILIDGEYPVDISSDLKELLRKAQHNEYQEYDDIYQSFGDTAKNEGFLEAAASFYAIAKIEKVHGDRFGYFANLAEQNKLYCDSESVTWICLNCGYIHEGKQAPPTCPVCRHEQGYFVRLDSAPFTAQVTREFK